MPMKDNNLCHPDDDTKALSCSVKLSKQTRAGVENKEKTPQETPSDALVAMGHQKAKMGQEKAKVGHQKAKMGHQSSRWDIRWQKWDIRRQILGCQLEHQK